MADIIKVATRDAYGKALVELGEKNPNVLVLDADLAAATKTGAFKNISPLKTPVILIFYYVSEVSDFINILLRLRR